MSHEELEERKLAEAEFHDRRARERTLYGEREFKKRWSNNRFYTITRMGDRAIADWMRQRCKPGASALDYCCGQGDATIQMARLGASAHGIDISAEEIAVSSRKAVAAGVADRAQFRVMDAEALEFPDASFDLIICNGVLHHLDVERAYGELARVLKPGGEVLCIEALGYNPLIQFYRRRTPHLRTAWEVDHILTLRDVKKAKPYFGSVSVSYYYLLSIMAVPFRDTPLFNPMLAVLEALDRIILRIPVLRTMAWQMMFRLSRPLPDAGRPHVTG